MSLVCIEHKRFFLKFTLLKEIDSLGFLLGELFHNVKKTKDITPHCKLDKENIKKM